MGAHLNGILLDTHALLWWLENRARLSSVVRQTIENPQDKAMVSAASAWEIAIKQRLGKLRAGKILDDFERVLEEAGFTELAITTAHALPAGSVRAPTKIPLTNCW